MELSHVPEFSVNLCTTSSFNACLNDNACQKFSKGIASWTSSLLAITWKHAQLSKMKGGIWLQNNSAQGQNSRWRQGCVQAHYICFISIHRVPCRELACEFRLRCMNLVRGYIRTSLINFESIQWAVIQLDIRIWSLNICTGLAYVWGNVRRFLRNLVHIA